MTYEQWMNEIENYSTRYDRFLDEWDNGMDSKRMEEWLKSAYQMGLDHASILAGADIHAGDGGYKEVSLKTPEFLETQARHHAVWKKND